MKRVVGFPSPGSHRPSPGGQRLDTAPHVWAVFQVEPFASLSEAVRSSVPRVFMNKEAAGPLAWRPRSRDVLQLGDLVDSVGRLVELLGWSEELTDLIQRETGKVWAAKQGPPEAGSSGGGAVWQRQEQPWSRPYLGVCAQQLGMAILVTSTQGRRSPRRLLAGGRRGVAQPPGHLQSCPSAFRHLK